MTNLIVIPETLTSGFSIVGLDILSYGGILSGILVITARNPVISVLFLIALFVNIAGYLILLGISFIGLSYITVYVGAIAILFLFVIFLLDIKLAELHVNNNKTSSNLPLGGIIGIAFLYPLYSIIPSNVTEMKSFTYFVYNWFNSFITGIDLPLENNNSINNNSYSHIHSAITNVWDGNLTPYTQITSIGNVMYTNYTLWFFVASIILLLSMVSAISLTFKPQS